MKKALGVEAVRVTTPGPPPLPRLGRGLEREPPKGVGRMAEPLKFTSGRHRLPRRVSAAFLLVEG